MSEEVVKKGKKNWLDDNRLELVIIVLLGLTALLTAWASWIGSLHGGNQATNYTSSNNMAADGNSRYNEAAQNIMQDMMLWSEIGDLQYDIMWEAGSNETGDTYDLNCYKLYTKCMEQMGENMMTATGWDVDAYSEMEPVDAVTDWLAKDEAMVSPFADDDFYNAYFEDANNVLMEAEELKIQGQADNTNGDKFGLVSLLYSIVLFLLGIAGTFKNIKNKYVIVSISVVCLIISAIYMFTIPLPTGFDFIGYFAGK